MNQQTKILVIAAVAVLVTATVLVSPALITQSAYARSIGGGHPGPQFCVSNGEEKSEQHRSNSCNDEPG